MPFLQEKTEEGKRFGRKKARLDTEMLCSDTRKTTRDSTKANSNI